MNNQKLVFYASRTQAVSLLLGSVAFVAIGWWMKEAKPFIGWLSVVFFGLGIPVALIMLLPGVMYLRLDQVGFEMGSLGRKNKIRWQDVESFKIGSIRGAKMIAITYKASFSDQKMARAVAGALAGMEGAIPNSYNVSLEDLERVLNDWLERFGHKEFAEGDLEDKAFIREGGRMVECTSTHPFGTGFEFNGEPVGFFEGSTPPTADGRYRYVAFRGPGHLHMHEQLKAGAPVICSYGTDDSTVSFVVVGCPESGVLDLAHFSLGSH